MELSWVPQSAKVVTWINFFFRLVLVLLWSFHFPWPLRCLSGLCGGLRGSLASLHVLGGGSGGGAGDSLYDSLKEFTHYNDP